MRNNFILEELNKILSENFIVDLRDHRYQTFLQWAASYGTPEIVELIYSKLSDNYKHDPMALTLAVLLRRMNICRTLLQHKEVISEGDITKTLQKAYKLTKEEKEELEALMTVARKKDQTQPDVVPQTAETKNPREDGTSLFQRYNPKVGDLQSKSMSVKIAILCFVICFCRRIAVHLIQQLIRILPGRYTLFISDLKFHGRYLCQWLCELIGTSLAHDDEFTVEESVTLFNELFSKSPKFYQELSKRCNFISHLERFRNIQLLELFQHLGIVEFGTNDANCIISDLLKASHLRIHGWSFFGLGQDLVIYNEMTIFVLGNNSRDKITCGYVYTSGKETEIITFSSPVRANKCKGVAYKLLCLVDFVRRNNPEREIGRDRRIPEGKQPQEGRTSGGSAKHIKLSSPNSNASSPNTTQIWRTKEQMISMGEFNLETFQSENGEFFVRVKACDNNFFLFPEWPNYTFYCVDECPYQIKSEEDALVIKQFLIDETNFRVKYRLASLIKSLPHLNVINSSKRRICRTPKTQPKLCDIATEVFNVLSMENDHHSLNCLKNSFEKLKNLLLGNCNFITSDEVISSDIVRALLQCLSISHVHNASNKINELSEMDELEALMNRREVFLSIFNHKPAFSKLIQCIKTAFEEIEHLPLYLFSYLHTLRSVLDNNSGPFINTDGTVDAENYILPEKGGMERSIPFHILCLLSSWLYTRRSNDKYKLHDPLFTWNIELSMTDSSELIILDIKNQFSIIQALRNCGPNLITVWYENSKSIKSVMEYFRSHSLTEFKTNMPYIKWLSSCGGNKINWIDAAHRGYIPAYSFLPNCQGVYHSGVDIPLLKSPSSGPCIVCNNKASTRRHFPDINIESFLSNLQVGARYVVDLRAEFIPSAYCLTTLRNVDRNEDLENWCLQASNDGKSWTTLKVHKSDRNLNSKKSLFFKLKPSRLGFRLFRIMDLSPINNQGRMHVCGLDFCGVVKEFHQEPVEFEVLAYIPESIRLCIPPEVPTVAEFYMKNLMKSIRDNEFHVPCSGYSDSVYDVATGLKLVRSNAEVYSEVVPLLVPPISKNYQRLLEKIKSQIPMWRLQFELIVEQQNGSVIASEPIFDLRWPFFPHLVDLAEQLVVNKVSKDKLQGAKLLIQMKSISPEEKGHMRQELLYQLSELRGDFGEADDKRCFISQHLTRKLERQFKDNIAVMTGPAFPNWCFSLTQKMNFLFPFELRQELFKACAFGPARSIKWLQDNRQNPDFKFANDHFYSYMPYIINSAFEDMINLDLYVTFKEIKCMNQEVLNGEISTDKTEVFRNLTGDDNGEQFWNWAERVLEENAENMTKLTIRFEAPYPRNTIALSILRRFYAMGLAEGHLLGLHLSRPFLKILCAYSKVRKCTNTENPLSCIENSRNGTLSNEDIWIFGSHGYSEEISPHWLTGVLGFDDFAELYPFHASTFRSLLSLAKIHDTIRKNCQDNEKLEILLDNASLQHMKVTIENLGLSMEFSSTSSESYQIIELKDLYPWELNEKFVINVDSNENESINNNNFVDYIRRTVEYCLNKGIQAQIDAFTRGVNQVFPLEWLSVFTSSELNSVLCGEMVDVAWEKEELTTYITTSNALSKSSPLFEYFVDFLVGLNAEQRRSFLRWTTGYSTLPSGGIKNLNPPLKIYNIQTGPYPRVQACFHALYLPEYSSASELRLNLLTAISQESFELL
ncbi:unnamed protein product [Hymenolepis diminuta]|uniref:E3 ubiquitin-protein ligase n=1 Tax=Hymenolepis diminuta TaxID=6216 RepID=A0A0R3SWI2_HYMDI|nr:unnamed protein product [Hymenolepis diminuta]